VVLAPLREAATEVVAEDTVAESIHSIQLHPAKSEPRQAGPTLPLAQFRLMFLNSRRTQIRTAHGGNDNNERLGELKLTSCYAFFWSHGSYCTAIPSLGALRGRPGNVPLFKTPGVKASLAGFQSPENRKDGNPSRSKPSALPLCVDCL
jgi:hypothetical protein